MRQSRWQIDALLFALIASLLGVVLTIAYYAAYGRQLLLLSLTQRIWFTTDALLQLGTWVLLLLAFALHLRRRISPLSLYLTWSALHVLWLPISAVVFVSVVQGYPPPIVLLPFVTLFFVGPVGFLVVALLVLAYWLVLPIFVLMFFCRRLRVLYPFLASTAHASAPHSGQTSCSAPRRS